MVWSLFLLVAAASAENFILSTVGNSNSVFNDYDYVKQSGYTHVGAPNIMMCVSYAWLSPEVYPKGSPAEVWREKCVVDTNASIAAAHAAGLKASEPQPFLMRAQPLISSHIDQQWDGRLYLSSQPGAALPQHD